MIGDKIVEPKCTEGVVVQSGCRGGGGAIRGGDPEVQVPDIECRPPDMKAKIVMPEVSVEEFYHWMLFCCQWCLYDARTCTEVPLETLPGRENQYGVSTWIQNEEGVNRVYASTNNFDQMPGFVLTEGINGDNFQLKYHVRDNLSDEDLTLAEKMTSKKPFYNYALLSSELFGKVRHNLGKIMANNMTDTFFYNPRGDKFKFFVGNTEQLLDAKDWDYSESELLGTVKLSIVESKTATVGPDGRIIVTTTLKQKDEKGSSAGVTEFEDEVDRIPMFESSVAVFTFHMNPDRILGEQSIPQDKICYLCNNHAIELTRNEEVYASCGHTSLCSNCVSQWNKKNSTCPMCRHAWNAIIISNNKLHWENQKRLEVDAPAELQADAPAELPPDAPAELPADAAAELPADAPAELPAVYDAEHARKRVQRYQMANINTQSQNMFVNRDRNWSIVFNMKEHDGKDDEEGVEVFPKSRTLDSLTYMANAQQLLKVKIQNKSQDNMRFIPVYLSEEGDQEPEDVVNLQPGEEYEMPYPVEKEKGDKQDSWLLQDVKGNTVLTLNFTVEQ